MKLTSTQIGRIPCVLLPLAVLWSGCQSSDQTGEIGVYKASPVNLSSQPERSSALFVLRERGFPVSENQFRLANVLGDFSGVGVLTVKDSLKQVVEDAYRAQLQLESLNESESPKARLVRTIHTNATELLKRSELNNGTKLRREAHLSQVMAYLADTRNFVEDLNFALEDARDVSSRGQKVDNFDIMFRLMGHPLLPEVDWRHESVEKLKKSGWIVAPEQVKGAFTQLFKDRFQTNFSRLKIHWQDGASSGSDWQHREIGEKMNDLSQALFFILEDSLNLATALATAGKDARHESEGEPKKLESPKSAAAAAPEQRPENLQLFLRRFGGDTTNSIRRYESDYAFARIKLNLDKLNYLVSQIITGVEQELRESNSTELGEIRVKAERLAEDLADMTQRRAFRKLQPAGDGKPPTHVTFLLKTLYLRHLGNGRQSNPLKKDEELLVTCAIKTEKNAEDIVYPVIFEVNYAPSLFVNRVDRIIYGPAAYTGQMVDVRLTVMELDDLNNEAITSGFASLTATVGALNPEFSAVAPAVNALFGTILKATTANDKEMDFSFLLPQPEGEGMPDTDFLIAETGHYIVIKAENPLRPGVSSAAAKRQFYRRLIYNPADAKLYHRKFFHDAKANFKEEYLFTDQNYAVIVVTDEYTQPDNLGEQLRKQVASSLGERRSKQVVPDAEQTRQLIESFKTLTGAPQTAAALSTNASPGFKRVAVGLKDELWQPISDLRKQFIVETLYSRADEAARLALDKDPEKWKKTPISIDEKGMIHLTEERKEIDKSEEKKEN